MNIKIYDGNTLLETATILDPDIYKDTKMFVSKTALHQSDYTSVAYRQDRHDISIFMQWNYLDESDLDDIVYVIKQQNTYYLVYTYDGTDYIIYFNGSINFMIDNIDSLYPLSLTMISKEVRQ